MSANKIINREDQAVELIASGYEWICPACDTTGHEIEVVAKVICKKCKREWEVGDYHHATP